jgi:hypothetical protein
LTSRNGAAWHLKHKIENLFIKKLKKNISTTQQAHKTSTTTPLQFSVIAQREIHNPSIVSRQAFHHSDLITLPTSSQQPHAMRRRSA